MFTSQPRVCPLSLPSRKCDIGVPRLDKRALSSADHRRKEAISRMGRKFASSKECTCLNY